MTLPTFLVIGAGRSGTTSLDRYLRQHPEIYLTPRKAPSYFFCSGLGRIDDPSLWLVARNYFVPKLDDYEALFANARPGQTTGEVSPVYLATVHAAPEIASLIPAAKLIAVIRSPVDRVYARFVARHRDGLERRPFAEVVRDDLREPLIRDVAFGTYLAAGFCSHFLQSYVDRFPPEQICVHLFDDLLADPAAVMVDLFDFLGVDSRCVVDTSTRHNRSGGVIRQPLARSLWTRTALARAAVRRYVPARARDAVFSAFTRDLVPMPIDPKLRAELIDLYRDEVDTLGQLLGRDLSHWNA